MYSPLFHSHQGSSSSPVMEVGNEVVDQDLEMEENANEMGKEELDLDILEQPNEGVETRQKGDDEGVKLFEKCKGKRSQQYGRI